MKKVLFVVGVMFLFAQASFVHATPSTQIWIPSTDIQEFGVVHLGVDNYNTLSKNTTAKSIGGDGGGSIVNYGLTVGLIPSETVNDKFGIEVGIDWREAYDDNLYFNAKAALYEDAIFKGSPSLAFGGYEFGTKSKITDANIFYGLAAKTIGEIGRISGGYYFGKENTIGINDNSGVLVSFDRSFGDKFWGAIDYMGGDNSYGALSFGVSYALSDKSSFIIGYDIYNSSDLEDTFTLQLDINF